MVTVSERQIAAQDVKKEINWDQAKEMFAEVCDCKNPAKFFSENDHFIEFNFPIMLNKKIIDMGLSKTELIKQTNIEKSYFYQILNGRRNPCRDKLLKIAVVMNLSINETQRFLIAANKSILYPKRRRDAAILCCINNKYNLHETQIFLHELEIEILE